MSNYPNFTLDTIHFFFDIYILYMVCICCSILLNYFPLYDIPSLCCFLSDQEYIVYIYMRCLLYAIYSISPNYNKLVFQFIII